MKIILASKSPRRIDILRGHGIDAVVMPSDADESLPAGIGMTDAVELLARKKAESCYTSVKDDPAWSGHVIIGADTIVWKDQIMGKPADADDAFRMLDSIRADVHYVVTGVALIDINTGTCTVLSDITEVHCKDYTDSDIIEYISTDEPYDKAGSYAIQGGFAKHIDHIEGDYENVVGLPYYRIESLLEPYI